MLCFPTLNCKPTFTTPCMCVCVCVCVPLTFVLVKSKLNAIHEPYCHYVILSTTVQELSENRTVNPQLYTSAKD